MELEKCPNCSASLKGIFNSKLVSPDRINKLNVFIGKEVAGYCTSCFSPIVEGLMRLETKNRTEIEQQILKIIHHVPVLTSPAPINWEYKAIDMVTTQTTAGTGFITELSQSFNDFFGKGSGTTNRKIEVATDWCKTDLRKKCLATGGNAIVSTDIDFSEVGTGSSNMLMVCMAGTAVTIADTSVLLPDAHEKMTKLRNLYNELGALNSFEDLRALL